MTPTLLYRISAVLLLLFAAGHTFGFLSFQAPTAEGQAVYDSMNRVQFEVCGSRFSYGWFYRGFGLSITFNILFLAMLAWRLGTLARSDPKAIGLLGWGLCALHVVSAVLSFVYFAAVPAILSVLLAICLGWAAARG